MQQDLNNMMMQIRTKLESIQRNVSIINEAGDSLMVKAKSKEGRQSDEDAIHAKKDIENMLSTIEGLSANSKFPECAKASGSVVMAEVDDSTIAVDTADSSSFEKFATDRINVVERDCNMLNTISDALQAAKTRK